MTARQAAAAIVFTLGVLLVGRLFVLLGWLIT